MMRNLKRLIIFLSLLFAIVQFIQLFLILLVDYSMRTFEIQLFTCSIVAIVMVNVHGVMNYCNRAGSASKSEIHEKSFKHCLYVVIYWTLSLTFKILYPFFSELNPSNVDKEWN